MARIRMLRGTGGPDGSECLVGDVVDVPEALATVWVRTGRAVPAATPDTPVAPAVEAGAPVVQSKPTPRKRTR